MGTRIKIHLLLAREARTSRDAFAKAVQSDAPSETRVLLGMALPTDIMGASSQGASGAGLSTFDAILEIWADGGSSMTSLANTLTVIGERVRPVIDHARSGVLAGTEHVIMPGVAPVCLFCALRRVEQLSREEFQRYWLDVHADFGRFPGNRYRQFHADAAATATAAAYCGIPAADFDGVAAAYFDDVDQLRLVLASPDIAADAFADERRFIAHSRSLFLPFAMQEVSAQPTATG